MSIPEVVAAVDKLAVPLVLLTGGEPMLQREIGDLAARLLAGGYRVMIETSGAHLLDRLPPEVVRIVDMKTPGSGETGRMRLDVLEGLRAHDAVKFVICDEDDYRWAADLIRTRGLAGRTEILLSPAHGQVDPRDLVAWMLRDQLPARLNLQLHKYVWPPDARGV
jgi:7-carboxy-7-deazaguanine synthase